MGLSFSKQVIRSAVRVRYVVVCRYLDEDGILAPQMAEKRTFASRNEAEAYAQAMPGTECGRFGCYAATVSTEYSRAD